MRDDINRISPRTQQDTHSHRKETIICQHIVNQSRGSLIAHAYREALAFAGPWTCWPLARAAVEKVARMVAGCGRQPTSLLVKDGILYVVADTGRMYAYDSKNGKELWTYNLGTVGKGSPVWADGKLYVMEVTGGARGQT